MPLRLGFRAYKLRNVSHGISACPLALLQVARKKQKENKSLWTWKEVEKNQRNVVSPRYYFQDLAVRNLSGGLQVWSGLWVTWVKNEKLSYGLYRFYSSSCCICLSSVFLSLLRLPYPSHISLQKLFPAFGILFEAKTQGSLSIPLRQSTSFFKTSLWEN